MADLFGAPAGIIAAEELGQRSGINALNSLKLMGDIAAQPAEAEYKRGLGRLHNADAESKEQATADAQRLAEIHANIAKASEGHLAQTGLPLTADAIDPETGRRRQVSPADQLFEYAAKMRKGGATPQDVLPLLDKAANIQSAVSTAAFREAQKVEREGAARKQSREAIGAIANSLLSNPQTYAQIRLQGTGYPELDKNLPATYSQAVPILQQLRDAAMTPDKAQKLKLEGARTASQVATGKATQAVAAARVESLTALTQKRKLDVENYGKTGGKNSPEAIQARADKAADDKRLRQAKIDKAFPKLFVDPTQRTVGVTYQLPDGRFARWEMNPATGKPGLNVVVPGIAMPAGADTEDEDEDKADKATAKDLED